MECQIIKTIKGSITVWGLFAAIVLTGIVAGSGVYMWQRSVAMREKEQFEKEKERLEEMLRQIGKIRTDILLKSVTPDREKELLEKTIEMDRQLKAQQVYRQRSKVRLEELHRTQARFEALLQRIARERIPPLESEKIIADRVRDLISAIKSKDMVRLSTFIHPDKGVRFSPDSVVTEESDPVFTATQIRNILKDKTKYNFGDAVDGPRRLTFEEYFDSVFYDFDFAKAEIDYNSDTAPTGNVIEFYPNAITVRYFYPGDPDKNDWEYLRFIFEKKGSLWYLVGIIHDYWTL